MRHTVPWFLWLAGTAFAAGDVPVTPVNVVTGQFAGGGVRLLAAPGYPNRILFVEPQGAIRYADPIEIWPTADSTAGPRVILVPGLRNNCCRDGIRMIAAAFPRQTSSRAFCYIARSGGGVTVISRLNRIPGGATAFFTTWDLEEPLLTIGEEVQISLHVAADDRLLIATGTGASSYAGRILRADVESPGAIVPEVLATGLRKPWLAGDAYVIDSRENSDALFPIEIGLDYSSAAPLATWSRPPGCNVSGAAVHGGARIPEWAGAVLVSHDCSSQLVVFRDGELFPSNPLGRNVFAIAQAGNGEIYVASTALYRLDFAGPSILPGGVTNVIEPLYAPAGVGPIQPGSLATAVGRRFLSSGRPNVRVNGEPAPVLRVGTIHDALDFITFQVPLRTPEGTALVEVQAAEQHSPLSVAEVARSSPRILIEYENSRAQVLRADGQTLGPCVGSMFGTICPGVAPGEIVSLFATGLGPVENPAPDGQPATASPLSGGGLAVTIGGVDAAVLWAGLAPGLLGVYQVNLQVPGNVPNGRQDILITADGRRSGPATLNVRRF